MNKIKDYLNKAKTFDDLAKEILDYLKALTNEHLIVHVSYSGDKGYLITKENCVHSESNTCTNPNYVRKAIIQVNQLVITIITIERC